LQKEVDIEMKIQQGLEKIIKVKNISRANKKKQASDMDVLLQLEKSNTRLEVLKHEMQKRRVQLQAMQAKHDAAFEELMERPLKRGEQTRRNNVSNNSHGNLELNPSVSGEITKPRDSELHDDRDGGLIRVLAEDDILKTQTKKAIYISNNQSTKEVICTIMQKMNIPGPSDDYTLSYPGVDNSKHFYNLEMIFLRDEDIPMQLENVNFAETMFRLAVMIA
jgi:Ras association (RalGDS/AF-6) domain